MKRFYYAEDNGMKGPFTEEAIRDLIAKGTLEPASQLFQEDGSLWFNASELPPRRVERPFEKVVIR